MTVTRGRIMNAAMAMTRAQESLVQALFRRHGDADFVRLDRVQIEKLRELQSQLNEVLENQREVA